MSKQELRVLSLGAGVQSTCLALMAARGEITPMPDYAIFADTFEPKHVYDHLKWLESEVPFPILTVRNGDIWREVYRSRIDDTRCDNPPFYTKNQDGTGPGNQGTKNPSQGPIDTQEKNAFFKKTYE